MKQEKKPKFINYSVVQNIFEKSEVELNNEYLQQLDNLIRQEIKKYVKKNAPRSVPSEYINGDYLLDNMENIDIDLLPCWVKDDLTSAKIIGNKMKSIILPSGRKYNLSNSLNHLDGSQWIYFTNSVINTNYSTNSKNDSYAHHIRKIHPTPKPPQLMKEIIEFFTKENEIVFDYFMGVGGTLLGASLAHRRAIGIDLNNKYIDAYKNASNFLGLEEQFAICGNSLDILKNDSLMKNYLHNEEISLVLIDPPYGNMMSKQKTGAEIQKYGNNSTPFTDAETDLGNMDNQQFLDKLTESILLVSSYVKKRGYFIIFIKDHQPKGKELNLLHSDIIHRINAIDNIDYKGMKIWADQTVKLYPYGYPFSFVSNQIHQYILVFRKEK